MTGNVHSRLAVAVALLSTGLLAGAFGYGWVVMAPTFSDVPLDVHLAYRVALTKHNGAVMPPLGIAATVALVWSAAVNTGKTRWFTAAGAVLAATSVLVTRFGNVPINGEIQTWAAGSVPDDYQRRLDAWGVFHDIRVASAVAAFALVVLASDRTGRMNRRHKSSADRIGTAVH